MSLARKNWLGQGVADILGRCQAIKQSAYVRIPCYTEATEKKLLVAVISITAVSFLSSNAFAFSAGHAKGIEADGSAIQVHHRHCNVNGGFACGGSPYHLDRCHHYRLCHYPYPNRRGADCCCSLLWPF